MGLWVRVCAYIYPPSYTWRATGRSRGRRFTALPSSGFVCLPNSRWSFTMTVLPLLLQGCCSPLPPDSAACSLAPACRAPAGWHRNACYSRRSPGCINPPTEVKVGRADRSRSWTHRKPAEGQKTAPEALIVWSLFAQPFLHKVSPVWMPMFKLFVTYPVPHRSQLCF